MALSRLWLMDPIRLLLTASVAKATVVVDVVTDAVMAVVVDEHGSVSGIVTVEDLVEEIIGEIGEEDRVPSPDAVREPDGSLILRGSVSVEKVQELFDVEWDVSGEESATTIAGLLNHVAGRVPAAGEHFEYGGLRFEILEANQRKVLRLRAKRSPAAVSAH